MRTVIFLLMDAIAGMNTNSLSLYISLISKSNLKVIVLSMILKLKFIMWTEQSTNKKYVFRRISYL